jgi:hypothetical protein
MIPTSKLICAEARLDQDAAELQEQVAAIIREQGKLADFLVQLVNLNGPDVGDWLRDNPQQREAALTLWMKAGRVSIGRAAAAAVREDLDG